jgi:NAD(P)-dependent dehydrogenase (short-subunit alcohol dehydrogenase family)
MAVVLITGCSSGIGKLSALEFARRGHRVYASMRNLENAQFIRADAENERLAIEIVQLDVTDETSIEAAIAQVTHAGGRLDVLVNNAGVGSYGPVEDYTDDEIKRVFETNFFGAVKTTRAVLPAMRAQRSGTIIMVSSISGLRTFPFGSVYAASKAALEAISDGLRYELRTFGIRVVLVEPGSFETRAGVNMHYPKRLMPGSGEGTSDPEYVRLLRHRAEMIAKQLVLGDARDVATTIADAAEAPNPEARYLVGDDARRASALSTADFEQMILEMMKLPE